MAAQGLGAPRACPGPGDGNSGKREAALMRRVERGEITLQGTPVSLRSNEKGPHLHSTSAASKLCLQGPGLWTPAGSRGTGQCGRSLGLRFSPNQRRQVIAMAHLPYTSLAHSPSGRHGCCPGGVWLPFTCVLTHLWPRRASGIDILCLVPVASPLGQVKTCPYWPG